MHSEFWLRVNNQCYGPSNKRDHGGYKSDAQAALLDRSQHNRSGTDKSSSDIARQANTLAFYETNITTHANACSIGGVDFYLFNGSILCRHHFQWSWVVSFYPNASEIEITPVAGGITITPLNDKAFRLLQQVSWTWSFRSSRLCQRHELPLLHYNVDYGLCYCIGISFGTPGVSTLTGTYCIGGVVPRSDGTMPPETTGAVKQDLLTITPSGSSTVSQSDNFSAVSQISMDKGIYNAGIMGLPL